MARLAERNAALQEELERAKAALGSAEAALEPKDEELATMQAAMARLAEENAELAAAAEEAEHRAAAAVTDEQTTAAMAAAEVRPRLTCLNL